MTGPLLSRAFLFGFGDVCPNKKPLPDTGRGLLNAEAVIDSYTAPPPELAGPHGHAKQFVPVTIVMATLCIMLLIRIFRSEGIVVPESSAPNQNGHT